jgi:chromosome segregation ATPase
MITDEKYKTLINEIRGISSDIASLNEDLIKDRQGLADLNVKIETLKSEVEQLRKEISAVVDDVGDRVKNTLKPAVKEVSSLKEEIEKKKVVTRKIPNRLVYLFKLFKK